MKRVSETEDDLILEIPLVVRVSVIRVQPALAVIAPLDVEKARIAIGVRNWLHGDPEPVAFGLIG